MKLQTNGYLGFFLILLAPLWAQVSEVRIGLQLEPPSLDPTSSAAAATDEVVYTNVFEGLIRMDKSGELRPGLAKSWQLSADGLTYTFDLQAGVSFHDGSPMDADDVIFSLNRARGESSVNSKKTLFANITSVKALDPLTVEVKLKRTNGNFLFDLARGDAVIVAPESVEQAAYRPIGTGAFVFSAWQRGDRIELQRNPNYWGPAAKLSKVTFRYIVDPTAASAAMMAGDIDAYVHFPAPENVILFERDPRFKILSGSSEGEVILATNNGRAPFDQLLVRKAIAHAIDRQALIKGAMYGYAIPIGSAFAPHHPDYIDLTSLSAYDPGQAKKLLAQAGLGKGFATTLVLPPPSYARRSGEIIAAQLRQVGIEVKILNMEWSQWLEQVYRQKNYDLTIVAHIEPLDIGNYARPDYYYNYHSDEFNQVYEQWRSSSVPQERSTLIKEAQRILAQDYVNGFLFQVPRTTIAANRLMGLWKDGVNSSVVLTQVYWEK